MTTSRCDTDGVSTVDSVADSAVGHAADNDSAADSAAASAGDSAVGFDNDSAADSAAASAGDSGFDIAVVGAGPAGLRAALAAVAGGAVVALVDAEPVVGGQFWRHPASAAEPGAVTDAEVEGLHHDLAAYRGLRSRLAAAIASGRLAHLAGHEVWSVQRVRSGAAAPAAGGAGSPSGRARFVLNAVTRGGGSGRPVARTIRARTLVLATGAYDLQLPFPGWDLPGVMTAGGVQSLLKGHHVLAGDRVVIAGTGPFLLSVASGLARSGAQVVGVFEAGRPMRWLRDLPALAGAGSKVAEGFGYAKDLVRHRIPYRVGWTVLSAQAANAPHGPDRLASVTVAPVDGTGVPRRNRARTLAADVLAVGWGFAPQVDLAIALGCHAVPDPNGLPVLVVDAAGRTSVPGVYAAGEVTGVGGAGLAAIEGELAGLAAAGELAGFPGDGVDHTRMAGLLRRRRSLANFAAALYRTYPVPSCWLDGVTDETLICRCEEVTAGAIRRVVEQDGVRDARTAKLLVRPGMGWCQGRICGYATERWTRALGEADAETDRGSGPVATGATERPVVTPVPLGLLAEAADRSDQ